MACGFDRLFLGILRRSPAEVDFRGSCTPTSAQCGSRARNNAGVMCFGGFMVTFSGIIAEEMKMAIS
jgi:hypothetical protein